jgi:hypothetical protein
MRSIFKPSHGCADLKLALGPRSALVAATGVRNSVNKMKRTRAIEMSFESRMIALLVRDEGVAGSNPATPTST